MMCASLLQFSMVGFSVCISSRNLIIANFSRCVRSLFSETHLTLYFYLNVIAPSIAQALLHQNDWDIVDILRCQSNNYQITSGLYQHDNTLTIDLKKNWSIVNHIAHCGFVQDCLFCFQTSTVDGPSKFVKAATLFVISFFTNSYSQNHETMRVRHR
jgi:hypothetical protein